MELRFLFLLCTLTSISSATGQSTFKKTIKNHRANYKQTFLMQEGSPFDSAGVQDLSFFRPKSAYQVTAVVMLLPDSKPFEMLTYNGEVQPYVTYGKLHFTLRGEVLELTVYRSLKMARLPMFRDKLFLPFKDQTNAKSTYGGGRYLDFRIGDINEGKLIIDFNKAYNPLCAYSDGYSCPIPPFENHLLVKVKAGEKVYKK